ncbi:hypothetical protein HDV00_006523 [Rhizophlyctis rosea]|nr:hypothetical protein HDV00_006523 [Rhizophlyctis rosea]
MVDGKTSSDAIHNIKLKKANYRNYPIFNPPIPRHSYEVPAKSPTAATSRGVLANDGSSIIMEPIDDREKLSIHLKGINDKVKKQAVA